MMEELLLKMVEREASDLHLVPGYPPVFREHGRLRPEAGERLTAERIAEMVGKVVTAAVLEKAGERRSFDCSVALPSAGVEDREGFHRYRANLFYAQGALCACFRYVPSVIPTLEWMTFPESLAEKIIGFHNGLVIITGVTGAGKTTTLAALVNMLNQRGDQRIITVEEPIEYLYEPAANSVVSQREVGIDVPNFYEGLKSGLRQDPDVVLVGEIRDPDTARTALSAAETGHLILATMHTQDAKGAISRFVDLFPHNAHDDVRSQLSLSLRTVVSQHLLRSAEEGARRVLALEILHVNNAVRSAIRFGRVDSIESLIQTGVKDGMVTLDESLERLARAGRISVETARRFMKHPTG
jgi:twitching motility protein PilT